MIYKLCCCKFRRSLKQKSKNYTTVYRPQVAVTNEWAVPGLSKESWQRSVTCYDALGRTSQVLLVAGSLLGTENEAPIPEHQTNPCNCIYKMVIDLQPKAGAIHGMT